MDFANLIISLVSGVVGGNIAGAAMQEKSLGALGNSISGLVGGGVGQYILQALGLLATVGTAAAAGGKGLEGFDLSSILTNIGGSGAGGAILTAVIALIKSSIQKNS